jgi:hypothetical protein
MKQTIRNATTVLQQARLMVAQNKNKYDLKGCVSALDACMMDDFVCGGDYVNCLDTTGQYIVNGDIVLGSEAAKSSLDSNSSENDDDGIEDFLTGKIGAIDTATGRTSGMCSSILNQCQNYTIVNGQYEPNNEVIKQYLARTLTKIRIKQQEVLAEYGESCRQDIIACFTKNGATSASPSVALTTAISACQTYVKTCSSVNNTPKFKGDVASYVCPNPNPATEVAVLSVSNLKCITEALP